MDESKLPSLFRVLAEDDDNALMYLFDEDPNPQVLMPKSRLIIPLLENVQLISVCAFLRAEKCFETLLNMGASPYLRDFKGHDLLYYAIAGGSQQIIRTLGTKILIADPSRYPVHIASKFGHLSVVQDLWVKGISIEDIDEKQRTPLYMACKHGHTEVAKFLISNFVMFTYDCMIAAVINNHSNVISLLLESGMNPNETGKNNTTPLVIACESGSFEAAKVLVKAGADVNSMSKLGTPLFYAAMNRNFDIANLLVQNGGIIKEAPPVKTGRKKQGDRAYHPKYDKYSDLIKGAIEAKQVSIAIQLYKNRKQFELPMEVLNTAILFNSFDFIYTVLTDKYDLWLHIDQNRVVLKSFIKILVKITDKTLLGNFLDIIEPQERYEYDLIKIACFAIPDLYDQDNTEEYWATFLEKAAVCVNNPALMKIMSKILDKIIKFDPELAKKYVVPLMSMNSQDFFQVLTENNLRYGFTDASFLKTATIETMKCMFSLGFPINFQDDEENNLLQQLINMKRFSFSLYKFLIEEGVEVNNRSKSGHTAFSQIITLYSQVRNEKLLKYLNLLLKNGVDPNETLTNGETPLTQLTISTKNLEAIQLLLDNKANINLTNSNGDCPLIVAIKTSKSIAMIEFLIKNGADIDHQNKEGETPLIIAILAQNEEISELLLNRGANPNLRTIHQETPLLLAAMFPSMHKIVKLLISKGSYINARSISGNNALFIAMKHKSYKCIQTLLDNGVDFMTQNGTNENILLMAADNDANSRQLAVFIDSGIDVNSANNKNETALFIAVKFNAKANALMLIEKGANPNIPSNTGETSLTLAAKHNHWIRLFRHVNKKHFDLNVPNRKGETCLIISLFFKAKDIAKFLMFNGAEINCVSSDGMSPILIASESEKLIYCLFLLLLFGAEITTKCINSAEQAHNYAGLYLLLKNGGNKLLSNQVAQFLYQSVFEKCPALGVRHRSSQ